MMGKILDKMTSLYTATKFLKLVETLGADVTTTFAHMFRYTIQSSTKRGPERDDFYIATSTAEGIVDYVKLLDKPGARVEMGNMLAEMEDVITEVLDEYPGLVEDCRREALGNEDQIAKFIVTVISIRQSIGPGVFADGLMMAMAIDIIINDKDIQQSCQEFCDVLVDGFRTRRKRR
jgi:hypothetical protein